jgi:hypothetical protein
MRMIDMFALNPNTSRSVDHDNDSDDDDDVSAHGNSVSKHSGADSHSVVSGGMFSMRSATTDAASTVGGGHSVATGMTGMTGMTGRLTARSAAESTGGSEAHLERERQKELERLRARGMLEADDDDDVDDPGYRRPPPPCVVEVIANPLEEGDELIVFHTPLKGFIRRLERRNEGRPLYGCGCGAGKAKSVRLRIDDEEEERAMPQPVGRSSHKKRDEEAGRTNKYIHIDDFLALLFETHFDGLVMDVASTIGAASPGREDDRGARYSGDLSNREKGANNGQQNDLMATGGTLTRAKPFKRSKMSRRLDAHSVRDAQLLVRSL